ncbi:hypothetical protein GF337_06815 [candidate division KSB1 bacterium]|nr:hypothetical protein [candidate division KSB1 bacterium]
MKKYIVHFIALLMILFISSCAKKGLITEKYDEDFYRVKKLLPDNRIQEANVNFIIYSDNQSGWRVQHKFLDKQRWTSPKMLLLPFYQLYMLTNGFIGGVYGLRHVPDYGMKERLMVRDAIYETARKRNAAFIMNVGDINAADGRRPDHWKVFLTENKHDHNLLNEYPYLPVIGNHEYANDPEYGFPNYSSIFDYPRFYVIEFPQAAIYVVDSNFILDQNQFIENSIQDSLFAKWFVGENHRDTLAWLEKQFSKFDKKLKIVAMHHPPVTFGKHYADWNNPKFGNALIEKQNKLLRLFQRYNVDVVFSGHEHYYQHNILEKEGNMIHFLVGGGGGTPLRNPPDEETKNLILEEYQRMGHNVRNISQSKIYHYYIVNIESNKMTIDVIKVNYDAIGVVDRLEIR